MRRFERVAHQWAGLVGKISPAAPRIIVFHATLKKCRAQALCNEESQA
jgi:hypothetical protein